MDIYIYICILYPYIYIYFFFIIPIYASSNCWTQATDEEKKAASAALAKYEVLTDNVSRQRFVGQFADGGAGQGKDCPKFAQTFNMSLTHEDKTTVQQNEDYLTVGQILEYEGQSLTNFPDKGLAVADVQYLVAKNSQLHGGEEAEHPPDMDEVKPEYSRFWYVKSKGKTTTWSQLETKKLEGEASLKGAKQLEDGCKFLEGLGFQQPGQIPDISNVKHELIVKELETVK